MQPVTEKSSNFTDFQQKKCIFMKPMTKKSNFQRIRNEQILYFKNKSRKGESYADFCQNNKK